MMPKVGIVAYGITPFSNEDKRIEDLLLDSVADLFLKNSWIDRDGINGVVISTNSNSKYLGPIVSEMAGIQPKVSVSIENLCSSGTNSLVSAYSYIASGLADMVLVAGAERPDSPGRILDWDHSRGEFKHPIFWGSLFTKSYKSRFAVSEEKLAAVPAKNHKQARSNPNSLSGKACSVKEILESRQITEDLRLLDCSRPCTGSASVVLASEKVIEDIPNEPVWITGIGQKTTSAGFTKSDSFHPIESTRHASNSALEMAKKDVKDIDVIELHDAFSVCEPMALESMGFSGYGESIGLIEELHQTDNFKVNPRGGLIGAGHPLGATGIAQTIEIVQQLNGRAGARQISDADTGLVHNMSAAATSSTVLVLER